MSALQKTYTMKGSEIDKKWHLIDAEGKVLGRMATKIADLLRGKNKPSFTPHLDMGDYVIVINAEKVVLTGAKSDDKEYFRHSNYPGGFRMINIKKIMEKKPEFIIEHAVKGMLPKSRLGKKILRNLKVYIGSEHPHTAQKPEKVDL